MRPFAHIVLADLRASRKPLSAYDLARRISLAKSKTYAPNTIYRCLRDLVAAGLIKYVASLKAFVALSLRNGPDPAFTICRCCGTVEEIDLGGIRDDLTALAERNGFAARRFCIEIVGECHECHTEAVSNSPDLRNNDLTPPARPSARVSRYVEHALLAK